ncbi:hypothetical protein Hte_003375 [Hypoxylon texense]
MKFPSVLSGLAALALASLASADDRTAAVYIQPISPSRASAAPTPLTEIRYGAGAAASDAEVVSYEAPELPEDAGLVRVGVYDPAAKRWTSSVSVASAGNFGKGYSPTLVLSVSADGSEVLGAALKGVRIDAGQTRDFGPQALVLAAEPGKQPELNKPVVLSPEGAQVVPEEKSLLQKYWWLIGVVVLLTMSGGGGGGDK